MNPNTITCVLVALGNQCIRNARLLMLAVFGIKINIKDCNKLRKELWISKQECRATESIIWGLAWLEEIAASQTQIVIEKLRRPMRRKSV